jgi:uncharacterized zinc-type alcohol dehydrogenase-like protein
MFGRLTLEPGIPSRTAATHEVKGHRTSPSTIAGYAAKAKGQTLERFAYEAPKLKDHEVRVSVTHCGICYSDLQAIDDDYGITNYPFVPGHEIVGFVSEVGPAVRELMVGARVGIGWQARTCGRCEDCLRGDENLCKEFVDNGLWTPYGGFAPSVAVDERFAFPLPGGMLSEDAAVLLCAGLSTYAPLRTYKAGPSSKVGIIGVGGLGHLAIQFAHGLGCEVTVFSSSPGKESEARAFGADHFLMVNDAAALKKLVLSLDLILYTSHSVPDWTPVIYTLRNHGRLVMIGFPAANVSFDALELVAHEYSITGSFLGNRTTMREMLAFAQAKHIKPRVELMPMAQVNEAIQRLKENRARYRIVLVNETDPAGT